MPSCCIPKCSNSSKKKYSMHRIPTDIERRNKWINNIGRSDLDPSKIYFICEVHFAPEMWERERIDGKKKLKSCAVPTVYCLQKKSSYKIDSVSSNIDVSTGAAQNKLDCEDFSDKDMESSFNNFEDIRNLEKNQDLIAPHISQAAISGLNRGNINKSVEEVDKEIQKASLETRKAKLEANQAKLKLQQASIIINKLNKSNNLLINRVKRLMYETTKLKEEICRLKQSKNFGKIFNDDQIDTLCRPSVRCDRWSDDTIQKALRLKLSCGSRGYKEILNQRIPLPSEQTLRRRLKGIDFKPDACENK